MMLRMQSSRGGLPGLVVALVLPLLVAGCASRSVSASALDVALVPGPPPPMPPQAERPESQQQSVEARHEPPSEQPSVRTPETPPTETRVTEPELAPPPQAERPTTQEQPVEARREQRIEPPPPSEQPSVRTPETPPAETRVTEPELAPPPEEKPPEVAAVAPQALPPTGPPAIETGGLSDVFFDFDKFVLRDDARPTLEKDAGRLKQQSGWKLLIEGHCDERGTLAYNLVLGERRAQAVRDYLANLGLVASQMSVMSFGKERPFCLDHSEACWQQNRRAHFVREP